MRRYLTTPNGNWAHDFTCIVLGCKLKGSVLWLDDDDIFNGWVACERPSHIKEVEEDIMKEERDAERHQTG